jgi:hypothetical protein
LRNFFLRYLPLKLFLVDDVLIRAPKDSLAHIARVGIDPLGRDDFGKAIGIHERLSLI